MHYEVITNLLSSWQFVCFQSKHHPLWVAKWKMFCRSENVGVPLIFFFKSSVYKDPSITFLWTQRSEYISVSSQATKKRLPLPVWCLSLVRPSFCLCDSCESQDGFTLSWAAEPYLDSNWVYFADSGQTFVSSVSICSVSNRFVLCMADIDDKRKQTRAQVEQRYCVIFVLGQQRWSHQQDIFYLSLMPLCCDA